MNLQCDLHIAADVRPCVLNLRVNKEIAYFPNVGGVLLIGFDIRSIRLYSILKCLYCAKCVNVRYV